MAISGCHEGKNTPKLVEVKCPRCGEIAEIFVQMGGAVGQTGTLVSDEACYKCGYILKEGSSLSDYEMA